MEVTHSFLSFLVANCAVVLASIVQTSTGMGFAMIAAPLLALISLEFVPGPMLFVNLFLSLFMLGDGRSYVVRREIVILCPMILIGTLVGVVILSSVPSGTLGILFSCLILLAVAITLVAKAQPLTLRNLSICGIAVGAMGSTSGIPGAPLVVLYQNEPLEKTRPTMALIFTFSYITSLVALSYGEAFDKRLAIDGLMLLPGLFLGFVVGKWVRQYMTKSVGRTLMLSIASVGAILLLVKSTIG